MLSAQCWPKLSLTFFLPVPKRWARSSSLFCRGGAESLAEAPASHGLGTAEPESRQVSSAQVPQLLSPKLDFRVHGQGALDPASPWPGALLSACLVF